MALGLIQRPAPAIWPHPRGSGPFLPALAVATLVNGLYINNPAALLVLSDLKDTTALSGLVQLTLPASRLLLVGRGRGKPDGVTLGGLPLAVSALGLDAAPPEPPRGFYSWTARVDAGGLLLLDLKAFKISDLRVLVR